MRTSNPRDRPRGHSGNKPPETPRIAVPKTIDAIFFGVKDFFIIPCTPSLCMEPVKKTTKLPLLPVLAGLMILIPVLFAAGCTGNVPVPPGPSLDGTRWTLTDYVPDGTSRQILNSTMVTLEFGGDGKITGSAGCNHYFSDYTLKGTAITIGQAGSTEMYLHCTGRDGTGECLPCDPRQGNIGNAPPMTGSHSPMRTVQQSSHLRRLSARTGIPHRNHLDAGFLLPRRCSLIGDIRDNHHGGLWRGRARDRFDRVQPLLRIVYRDREIAVNRFTGFDKDELSRPGHHAAGEYLSYLPRQDCNLHHQRKPAPPGRCERCNAPFIYQGILTADSRLNLFSRQEI